MDHARAFVSGREARLGARGRGERDGRSEKRGRMEREKQREASKLPDASFDPPVTIPIDRARVCTVVITAEKGAFYPVESEAY